MTEQQIQRVLGEVPLPPHEDWCCAKGCTGPGMCIAGGCGGSEHDCRCVVSEIREDRAKAAEALCAQVPDISAQVRELADEYAHSAKFYAAWPDHAEHVGRSKAYSEAETRLRALLDRPNGGE